MTLHFTRAELKRDAAVSALLPVLMPERGSRAVSHHLVWSLMSDSAERRRDYLFREGDGVLYVLSERAPAPNPLWDHRSRSLPTIAAGDRLRFTLRANPVVRRDRDGKTVKSDIVMNALHGLSREERRARRQQVTLSATREWLQRIGDRDGFTLNEMIVESYQQVRVPRRGASPIRFSTVDVSGVLTVTDPAAFLSRLQRGFGASRAWGCGLMLVRPV